jgi:hypothetical protein
VGRRLTRSLSPPGRSHHEAGPPLVPASTRGRR